MKSFFQLREAVNSAAKKPENFTDPTTGKVKTRMVPANKNIVKEEMTQVTVGDYTTKHFDMCPSAVKLYSNIKNMTPMVHLIVENMMLQDLFFRLEKQAVAQGTIDMDDLEKADDYAEMIMDNAEQMGLEEEHSYIEDVHMARFNQLAGVTSEEDDEEEDMNEKTLTPAELKKRKEVADAIKRDNPNMPMAKKMAIATATAKKVAEEVEELDEISKATLRKAGGKMLRKGLSDDPKAAKHMKYANMASAKLYPNQYKNSPLKAKVPATESVENIDELKKSTLGSYVKKASGSAAGLAAVTTAQAMSSKGKADKDDKRQFRNRLTGISRATDKLTKEEVELDEISRDLARRYIRKVADKTNTGELSTKEVEKRRPGVNLAGKKAYPSIAGKARVTATEEVEKVDEVSVKTLSQYTTKAAQQGSKRVAGQWMADQKLRKRDGYSSSAKVAATSTPKKD
jgi:hypothetical protein